MEPAAAVKLSETVAIVVLLAPLAKITDNFIRTNIRQVELVDDRGIKEKLRNKTKKNVILTATTMTIMTLS